MAAPFFSTPFQPFVYESPQEAVTPFQILGGEAQIVQIMLKPQEKVVAKPGSMCYMSGQIIMENVFVPENEAGVWQWLFGKSLSNIVFLNSSTADEFVGIAAPSLARILPIDLALFGGELLCQPDAFLCSINDVKVNNAVDHRARNVVPGVEGFLRQKLSGRGLAFIVGGGSAGTVAYMGRAEYLMKCRSNVEKAEDWLKPSSILEAFETRAFRMAVACSQNLSQFSNPEEGFAELSADLAEAALAHCQLIVVSKYIDKLKEQIPGKGIKQILEVLCQVYALHILHKHQGEFLATGSITAKQAALAFAQLRHLYSKVRPNAVALVDSFNHTDHYLGSILGRYDGNVYPKLYDAAWQDPLNDSDVTDGYTEYIRPLIKNQLHLARL